MHKGLSVLIAMVVYAMMLSPMVSGDQARPIAIRHVSLSERSVPRFGKLEINVDLSATYENPFDPDQIDVGADFYAPSGKTVHVFGFLWQDYAKNENSANEDVLAPSGLPHWKIRFAPTQIGQWSTIVYARDSTGLVRSQRVGFKVLPSADSGFVGVSRNNHRVLSLADGTPLFLIGRNMASGRGGYGAYGAQFADLHAHGGNWARVWMAPWMGALEWTPRDPSDAQSVSPERTLPGFCGLGAYNLLSAWQLDKVLDDAARNHIYVMLTLDQGRGLDETGETNHPLVSWKYNPYNAANGGPCQHPVDFWTDPIARKLNKQRIRYVCARYGWRTSIQSWELWNETLPPKEWVEDIARYMSGAGKYAGEPIDPYHHLITTSYCDTVVSALPEIDMTQEHQYPGSDTRDCSLLFATSGKNNEVYDKPFLIGEFGISADVGDDAFDDFHQCINMHNGLWSSVTSGCAGAAMMWYWAEWMYPQITAISRFVAHIPWTSGRWHAVSASPMASRLPGGPLQSELISPAPHWGKSALTDYDIQPGLAGDSMALPQFLLGPAKEEMRTVPVLHVDYPKGGQFNIKIDSVSDCCVLRILLDGMHACSTIFDPRPNASATLGPRYISNKLYSGSLYQARFDADVSVKVPAGRHRLTLSVDQGDWMQVSSYELTNYRQSNLVDATIQGVTNGDVALVWVRNRAYDWFHPYRRLAIAPVPPSKTVLFGLKPGRYTVSWINTQTGLVSNREKRFSTTTAGIELSLPRVDTDLALRIERSAN